MNKNIIFMKKCVLFKNFNICEGQIDGIKQLDCLFGLWQNIMIFYIKIIKLRNFKWIKGKNR